jgi:pseudouridine kinase
VELVVVVGGANVDIKARSTAALVGATSNPGIVVRTPGGVGRNVAENLARLGSRVALVSTVGSDPDGDWLLEETAAAGVDVSSVLRGGRTGRYVALLDANGELVAGVSDMAATDALGPEVLSVAKARRILPLLSRIRRVCAITPNEDELAALGSVEELHARGVEVVWVRRGAAGSLLSTADGVVELEAPVAAPVDVTGAGDAMLAAFCHRLTEGATLTEAAAYGHEAAAVTVASPHTVVPDLRDRMSP